MAIGEHCVHDLHASPRMTEPDPEERCAKGAGVGLLHRGAGPEELYAVAHLGGGEEPGRVRPRLEAQRG
eukprot:7693245-Alexandrium_andersonii.AAC.1